MYARCATFFRLPLILRGGGGQKDKNAPYGVIFRRLIAVSAVLAGGIAVAHHDNPDAAGNTEIRCPDGQYDNRPNFPAHSLDGIACPNIPSAAAINTGTDLTDVAIVSWADTSADPSEVELVVINRSTNVDAVYAGGADSEQYLVSKQAGPTLFLRNFAGTLTVPPGMQGTLGVTLIASFAGNLANIAYWSQPEMPAATGGDPGGNQPAVSVSAPAPGGGDGNARDLAVIGLGVGVVGFMAAYLSGGDFSLFNFAPDFGYAITESGYSVNTGGRLDFHKDEWHLYYAAGQANANGEFGEFRYESGGEYAGDLWTAAFSETVQGETADYDFSLSADYKGGIWKVSPTYRLHSHFADEEFDTQNSLNLRGELLWNRWTIRPSAGFNWRRPEEFGDNARFNLSAVRRF
ncbi:MAG: hypothetical protein ACR2QC_04865 [Gammaproteobacteria bacterium]